jgi:hypothetical protein
MQSVFESVFMGDVGIMQNRYPKKAGVWMHYGMSESLYINQAFGRG